jgi:hypothetical protein
MSAYIATRQCLTVAVSETGEWNSNTVPFVGMMWDSFSISFPTCDVSGRFENLKLSSYHGRADITSVYNLEPCRVSWKHCRTTLPKNWCIFNSIINAI